MRKIIVISICIFGCFGCGNGTNHNSIENILPTRQDIFFPVKAISRNPDTSYEGDTLSAVIENINFEIIPGGKILWGYNAEDTFHIPTDLIVEKAYLFKRGTLLWIFYTETDNEAASSRVLKIDLQAKKQIWVAEILGFNLGKPYIMDKFAYVTAIGFAGKLNLDDGKFVYQFSDLYDHEKYSFNSFDTILFRDDLTFFLSRNYHSKHMDSLIVNETNHTKTIHK